jgi:GT2 family glycosyltransferase
VVDNGSTDGTVETLQVLSSQNERVKLHLLDYNVGTTVSRNLALREVSPQANYVCILDSDTVVNRDAFYKMICVLEGDSSIGVVGPTMANSAGDEQLSGRCLPTLAIKLGKAIHFGGFAERAARSEMPSTPVVDGLQDVGYLLSACWLMPVSTREMVGDFDEKIYYAPEDVDWCLRCHKVGLRVVRCFNSSIIHEYQRLSHKKILSKTNVEHIKGLLHYFIKHRYLLHEPTFGRDGQ